MPYLERIHQPYRPGQDRRDPVCVLRRKSGSQEYRDVQLAYPSYRRLPAGAWNEGL